MDGVSGGGLVHGRFPSRAGGVLAGLRRRWCPGRVFSPERAPDTGSTPRLRRRSGGTTRTRRVVSGVGAMTRGAHTRCRWPSLTSLVASCGSASDGSVVAWRGATSTVDLDAGQHVAARSPHRGHNLAAAGVGARLSRCVGLAAAGSQAGRLATSRSADGSGRRQRRSPRPTALRGDARPAQRPGKMRDSRRWRDRHRCGVMWA